MDEDAKKDAELDELRRRLHHADRLAILGQVAAGIAHEINNPSAFVLMNLGLLKEGVGACLDGVAALPSSADVAALSLRSALKDLDALLEECTEGMQRIKGIMGELRAFARVDDNIEELVALDDVARVACRIVGGQVRGKARLMKDLQRVEPVLGDRGHLAQAVTNLLVNAAQALPEGDAGENIVRVSTFQDGAFAVLVVEDTGPGIPDHVKARVFEPFFTTKPSGQGTGLGLSLVAEIVTRLKGTIVADDRPGGGARFTVRLPVDQAAAKAPPDPPAEPARTDGRRARVLLVDDDAPLLKACVRALSPMHDVVSADGGRRAIAILKEDQAFDVVLCDVVMPDMAGASVVEFVRDHAPALMPRFLFLTGGAVTERARAVVQAQPAPVLEKPVSLDVLLEVIARVSSSSSSKSDS